MGDLARHDPWAGLTHDPRRPEHAHLRAADRDRDVVAQVLTEAYADGRLDRDELDQRSTQLAGSRTLGELPVLVADLLPSVEPGAALPVRSDPEALRAKALATYRRERREALWTMLSVTLICTVIWFATGAAFPWPLFVLLGTGLHYGRLVATRHDHVAREVERLERKEAKRIAKLATRDDAGGPPRGELPPGS